MGTSNFLYRDTLYALDTYVSPGEADCTCDREADCTCDREAECTCDREADCTCDREALAVGCEHEADCPALAVGCEHEADCTCDREALAVGCEHEADCPALDGYHDEFIYDDTKDNLMADLDGYRKANPNYTIYSDDDGWTNDNRNFEGRIIGRIYKEFTLGDEHTVDFTVGDDFCLRSGYYGGFNFDRVTCQYSTYGTNELENVTVFIHDAIFKYDKLCLDEAVDDGDLNFLEAEALKEKIYAEGVAKVEAFIAEADRIYHELGEKYFESYRVVAQDK